MVHTSVKMGSGHYQCMSKFRDHRLIPWSSTVHIMTYDMSPDEDDVMCSSTARLPASQGFPGRSPGTDAASIGL